MTQAELVADEHTVVVGEQVNAVEPKRVEQRHDVGEQLVARVVPPRGGGPAGPSQVGADPPELLGQPGDDLVSLSPVQG